ncbi:MAG: hypothetical protein JST60_05185 [Chloroflexi bacterium SZAS-1]|nr:hypothetical protein [Chloroflexi bacterium SZAS-1]
MIPSLLHARTLVSIGLARIWSFLRPALGWCLLASGIFGIIMPIIPGIPLMFMGMVLVGRRSVLLRWVSVMLKRQLRRWSLVRMPLVGPVGYWALCAQQQFSRQRRRLAWWYSTYRRSPSA